MTAQREGWLGNDYVRIYSTADRPRVAEMYSWSEFLPGYVPLGSWGLDALCAGPDGRVYLVDWIPLTANFRRERYATTGDFERDLLQLQEATPEYKHFQKEVHFVQPLVFGGNPKATPMMIDQKTHAEACCFWNRTYARLKATTAS